MADEIRAEMVANVWKVVAAAGDTVEDGDTLVILESMKMEIPVLAEASGRRRDRGRRGRRRPGGRRHRPSGVISYVMRSTPGSGLQSRSGVRTKPSRR